MENTSDKCIVKKNTFDIQTFSERTLFITNMATNLAILFMQLPEDVRNNLSIFSSATGVGFIGLNIARIVENNLEAKEIKKLYDEFIKNYNKLNKVFNLEDPVEIHTMFNYLLYKGYLSQDKQFKFSGNATREERSIMGANVLTGKGVCRHISSMLTNILQDKGIEAGTMGVCADKPNVNIKTIDEQKYTKEELLEWVHSTVRDPDAVELLTTILNKLERDNSLNIELEYRSLKEKSPIGRLTGNHAITYAYYDGKSYYLDPTQNRIYVPQGKILTDYQMDVSPRLCHAISMLFNKSAVCTNMNKRVKEKHPTLGVIERKTLVDNTLEICKDNTDIFEQFYRENEDLYKETANKVLSLKPHTTFLK